MLSIRRETAYAVKFLNNLANKKDQVRSLKEISEKTGVSFLFLQKIARKLRLKNIISSVQGVDGGYTLLKPAKKISLLEVIEATEGECDLFQMKNSKKLVETNKKITKILSQIKIDKI